MRWQESLGNGVCGLAFDRANIPMNKFVVTTLEAQFHVFDARTQHEKRGARGFFCFPITHLCLASELNFTNEQVRGDGRPRDTFHVFDARTQHETRSFPFLPTTLLCPAFVLTFANE